LEIITPEVKNVAALGEYDVMFILNLTLDTIVCRLEEVL
jgi:hypothetical protein